MGLLLATRKILLSVGLSLWLLGCRAITPAAMSDPALPPASATTVSPTLAASKPPPPTATPLPPLPTATATPIPATTTIAVPPQWETAVATAIQQLDPITSGRQWQVLVHDDPNAAFTQGNARLALVRGDAQVVVRREPLVLAVPFTTDWETTTAADAREVLDNGHPLVEVLPWSQLTPERRALRVDGRFPTDPDYPFHQHWSLAIAPGTEPAADPLIPVLQTALHPPPPVHLAAVGDLMLDRALGNALSQGKLDYPFAQVKEWLAAPDVTVGNLESALGDVGQPESKRYPFRAPPEAAQALAQAGFDVVSLANNHAMDYGAAALLQGIGLLRAAGVAPIGAGVDKTATSAPHVTEINGLRLAFLSYVNVPVEASTNFDTQTWTATVDTPGLAWGTTERVAADVAAAQAEADLVIVMLHSGWEYIEEPSEAQTALARSAVAAGADLVLGHHTHILQGIEFGDDNEGVIVYGLGNFAFEITGPPETAVLHAWLDADGVRQIQLLPATIRSGGQPRPAEPWEAGPIRRQIYYLTSLLNASNDH